MRCLFLDTVCLAVLGATVIAGPAMSQEAFAVVTTGDRIRLKTAEAKKHFYGTRVHESKWVTGQVIGVEPQFIHLKVAGRADTIFVRRDSVSTIEKSLGTLTRKGEGKFIGMLTGAVVGAAVGVGIVYSAEVGNAEACRPKSIGDPGCAGGAVVFGIVGFFTGGWVGRKAGGAIGDRIEYEGWERLRWGATYAKLSLGPVAGSSVGASLLVRY